MTEEKLTEERRRIKTITDCLLDKDAKLRDANLEVGQMLRYHNPSSFLRPFPSRVVGRLCNGRRLRAHELDHVFVVCGLQRKTLCEEVESLTQRLAGGTQRATQADEAANRLRTER
jgi:hypothetical protein